jgi:DNA-binding MarR family transcriptional regulator
MNKLNSTPDITSNIKALVNHFDKTADRTLRANLELTYSQFQIMNTVFQLQKTSQVNVADMLQLTQAAISKQLGSLVSKGFLIKKVRKNNKREHMLKLTKFGQETLLKAQKYMETETANVFDVLKLEERQFLANIINKINIGTV